MTANALREVLIAEIEEGNLPFVRDLLAKARQRIANGKGEVAPLLSVSLNGKTVQRALAMDAVQVALACRQALAAGAGDAVSSTSLDFSGI